jgi:hypothetical protein
MDSKAEPGQGSNQFEAERKEKVQIFQYLLGPVNVGSPPRKGLETKTHWYYAS